MVKTSILLPVVLGSMSTTVSAGPLFAVLGVAAEAGAAGATAGAAATAAEWVGAIGSIVSGGTEAASAISSAVSHHHGRSAPPLVITRRQVTDANTLAQQNKLAIQECHADLGKAKVEFSSSGAGSVLVKGLPATCMTLSTVLTGKFDEGNPVPMGSDSIQFSNLSEQSINTLSDALKAHH